MKKTSEYGRFENFMRKLISGPHSEIKTELDKEKAAKKRKKSRKSSASRATNA
jgi:hypothetical protein